jgi:hypothetical protein
VTIDITQSAFPAGLHVRDDVDGVSVYLLTDDDASLSDSDAEFLFPIEECVRVDGTTELRTPFFVNAFVRDVNGDLVANLSNADELTATAPSYVEFGGFDVTLYLSVESGSVAIRDEDDSIHLSTADASIHLGARSFHENPAATMTVTDDPADAMAAISQFGSALKTRSPERSFPTLRGHPPVVERGETRDVPDLRTGVSGVEITVPPDVESVFSVASLAYYLDATVRPGDPALHVDGERFRLDADDSISETATRYLKHTFTLDCVVRTEGLYDVELHERQLVESEVDVDLGALYNLDLTDRTREYLSVPFSAVEPAVPKWKTTADVGPRMDLVEALPYLAYDLAEIRPTQHVDTKPATDFDSTEIRDLWNTRSGSQPCDPEWLSTPLETESFEHANIGRIIPLRGWKCRVDDLRRHVEQDDDKNPQISVAVVNNDEEMADESVAADIYGTRDWYEFDVDRYENLHMDELADVIASDYDFFHYIGHNDAEGFRCPDGHLSASAVDPGIRAFLLNTCESFEQAFELIENGAVGGIATVQDIEIDSATEAGLSAARLLNEGYSLNQTQYVLDDAYIVGSYYIVFGDGKASLVPRQGKTPLIVSIEEGGSDEFAVTLAAMPKSQLGALIETVIEPENSFYLNSGPLRTWDLSYAELDEWLSRDTLPTLINRSLYWSHELTAEMVAAKLS